MSAEVLTLSKHQLSDPVLVLRYAWRQWLRERKANAETIQRLESDRDDVVHEVLKIRQALMRMVEAFTPAVEEFRLDHKQRAALSNAKRTLLAEEFADREAIDCLDTEDFLVGAA
jgi:hypothetical protein